MAVTSFLRTVFGSKAAKDTQRAQTRAPAICMLSDSRALSGKQSAAAFYRYIFAGSAEQPLTVPQKLVIDVVLENLSKKQQRHHAVPRLPSIIPKLLRSLRDPDSSAKDYVEIVNKDPAMSAAVLKLANSVYFNPVGSYIGNIERAIVKLGSDGLRSVLSAAVMQPIIQRDSPYFSQTGQRLWAHSLNTAVASELIAETRGMERFKAYLLGLVHDVGKITVFCELCRQYQLNGDQAPGYNAFLPPMRRFSAQLSVQIATDWELPEEVIAALQEQLDVVPGKAVSDFGQLLYQANIASEAYAFTPKRKRAELQQLCDELNLPQELFAKLDQVSASL